MKPQASTLITYSQQRCSDCGRFLALEFQVPAFCDDCFDARLGQFMDEEDNPLQRWT